MRGVSFLRSLDALRFMHLAMKVQHRWLVYLGAKRIRKVEKDCPAECGEGRRGEAARLRQVVGCSEGKD